MKCTLDGVNSHAHSGNETAGIHCFTISISRYSIQYLYYSNLLLRLSFYFNHEYQYHILLYFFNYLSIYSFKFVKSLELKLLNLLNLI